MMLFTAITLTIPPAAKILAISTGVYTFIQILKRSPRLAPYLKGWYAVALNATLSALATILAIPADQLYTWNTFFAVVAALSGASGIHGIVWTANPPQDAPAPADPLPPLSDQPKSFMYAPLAITGAELVTKLNRTPESFPPTRLNLKEPQQ